MYRLDPIIACLSLPDLSIAVSGSQGPRSAPVLVIWTRSSAPREELIYARRRGVSRAGHGLHRVYTSTALETPSDT